MGVKEKPKVIIVGGGKLPFWKIILSAVIYTIIAYYLFVWIQITISSKSFAVSMTALTSVIYIIGLLLPLVLSLSVVTTKYIDVFNAKLTKEYRIGPFKKRIFKDIPELEYVSVFKEDKNSDFEINIWYKHKGHKRFNIGVFEKKQEAMEYAEVVAKTLKIDFLDATERGNSKWIELD